MLTHEEYEYIFDAAPMLLGLLALNIFHPGHILQGPDSTFPKQSRAEKKALKAHNKALKMAEKRGKRNGSQGMVLPEGPRQDQQDDSMRWTA